MKLNAPTVLLIGIAAILGIVVFADFQGGGDPQTTDEAGQPLYDFEEADVQSFTVETPSHSLAFERDDEGVWQMTEPETSPASDASVSFLLNLLATEESDRILTVPTAELEDFGLESPPVSIDVTLQDETAHQVLLGNFDFNQQSMYALVDPFTASTESEETDVWLVSASFDTAVNRPVEEWKQTEPEPSESATPESDTPESDGTAPEANESEANESGANESGANESVEPDDSTPEDGSSTE